jgi:hypothetical protein
VKKRILIHLFAATLACLLAYGCASARKAPPGAVLQRTVDLRVGDAQAVRLSDGTRVQVKLLNLQEQHDDVNDAVRLAWISTDNS